MTTEQQALENDVNEAAQTAAEINDDSRVAEIRSYIHSHSAAELSRKSGVSSSVISQLVKGSYPGDTEGMMRKILSSIEAEKSRLKLKLKKPSFIPTSVYRDINYILEITEADESISVITGDAGIGKTEALRYYCGTHPGSVLIKVNPTYNDSTLLKDIADKLGLDTRGRKDGIFANIVSKLAARGWSLIIDEADYLNIKSMDVLRRIHDEAEVPVALVGLPRLLKMISPVSDKYAQIFSRMRSWKINGIRKEDAGELIANVLPDLKTELIEMIRRAAENNARRLVMLLTASQRIQLLQNDRELKREHIDAAIKSFL